MRAWRGICGTLLTIAALGVAGATVYGVILVPRDSGTYFGTGFLAATLAAAALIMLLVDSKP